MQSIVGNSRCFKSKLLYCHSALSLSILRQLNLELDPTLGIPFVSRYLSTVMPGDVAVGEIYARGFPEYTQSLPLAGLA